ncbi:MAG: hypothetical protein EYC70_12965 [Planctomycetota bacterium]|nr:MAG: hypothetical protein EYC70_12965 [Planctomycetota bacterium]
MDHYHIWVNLADSHADLEFARAVAGWLGHLRERGLIEGWRLSRRKLGFGPAELGEFHLEIETRDLAQLENAFQLAAARAGEGERLHAEVYSRVADFRAALYRDFPDAVRRE